MKKTLITLTIVILLGILIYYIYPSFQADKIVENKDKNVADLIQEQEQSIQANDDRLKKISEETDFDPEKSTPKEVSEKLDTFIKEMEKE